VEISEEKSKKSLAELYEDEYQKTVSAASATGSEPPKEVRCLASIASSLTRLAQRPEHVQLRNSFIALCSKLDALCNMHYTPRAATEEMQVVSNVAAINMEEVTPAHASTASLLAPEEVYAPKKGALKGETERTKTDKLRARREKKSEQVRPANALSSLLTECLLDHLAAREALGA
jgi:U3 small nucleolar RNA-associated protein MPP10